MNGQSGLENFLEMFPTKPRGLATPWYVFVHQNVTIEMVIVPSPEECRILIDSIESLYRGEGYASEAMNILCDFADLHGVELELSVSPFGEKPGLSSDALFAWYGRHGFRRAGNSDQMHREPSALREVFAMSKFESQEKEA